MAGRLNKHAFKDMQLSRAHIVAGFWREQLGQHAIECTCALSFCHPKVVSKPSACKKCIWMQH